MVSGIISRLYFIKGFLLRCRWNALILRVTLLRLSFELVGRSTTFLGNFAVWPSIFADILVHVVRRNIPCCRDANESCIKVCVCSAFTAVSIKCLGSRQVFVLSGSFKCSIFRMNIPAILSSGQPLLIACSSVIFAKPTTSSSLDQSMTGSCSAAISRAFTELSQRFTRGWESEEFFFVLGFQIWNRLSEKGNCNLVTLEKAHWLMKQADIELASVLRTFVTVYYRYPEAKKKFGPLGPSVVHVNARSKGKVQRS